MRLRPFNARGVAVACFAICALLAVQAPALARQNPRPVLDSAPAGVQYGDTAVVTGHFENGTGDEEITLQKEKDGQWKDLATKSVNENDRVSYELDDLAKTADYRLLWTSPDGTATPSDGRARIQVAARVKLDVSERDVMSGRSVRLRGSVLPAVSGREVILQEKVHGAWRFVTRESVADGRFSYQLDIKRRSKGYRPLRAIFRGDEKNTEGDDRSFIRVYSRSPATWYGPGFWGQRTACGERLQKGTLGVAHRTLPCGTKVSLLYRGRTITVPVIDRGPYGHHYDWDLTQETAERLRFRESSTIGVTR
ncbi:MAG TPA: septal ring lytic transglycosylase RlpA family protein [Actinomycetota bacterium]|nr:septal ring lytic transglycosylase RlpA family protein [Actinomycetota bacterium]